MNVGVRTYTVYDEVSMTDVRFKDYEGSFDVYDFNSLDSSVMNRKYKIIYDDKRKTWRVPFAGNESLGLVTEGESPVLSTVIQLKQVHYVVRQKID